MDEDGVDVGLSLAVGMRDLYAAAELALILAVAQALKAGRTPTGLVWQVQALNTLRGTAQRVVDQLGTDGSALATEIVGEARRLGSATAISQLLAIGATPAPAPSIGLIEANLQAALTATQYRISRWAPAAYQKATTAGDPAVWDQMAGKGVTGYVDDSGRNYDLTTYVEAATRTAAQQTWNEQHTAEYQAAGVDLVMVSTAPDCCPLCAPFQGAILSIGPVPDNMPEVDMSIDEARGDGLQHWNCRCSYSVYEPDMESPPTKIDPVPAEERDQERYLERGVRQWKRRLAAALDQGFAQRAAIKVRLWQSRIRQHVANSGQVRNIGREQIT